MALLDAVAITKRFGPLTVLRDVSFRVEAGEIVALVGETGAGKSTFVSCVAGILEPDGGVLHYEDAPMPPTPNEVRRAGIEIVWQEDGLCGDLDVMANVILGRERPFVFSGRAMRDDATSMLHKVGVDALPQDRVVRSLSRGQRQLVALARALLPKPRLLVLDEPTAPLSVGETLRIQGLIREVRDAGAGVLLVTHDLEQVFGLADRIIVLRQGRVVADTSPLEVQRADVVALMSGIEIDSAARRQLDRLRSLAEQLSDVEPAASLPLIVSSMAAALDQEMLCVHLLEESGPVTELRRTAAVGLPAPLLRVNDALPLGADGGSAGLAAETAEVVVVDDVELQPTPARYRQAAAASGIRSEWAAPIVGAQGVLGTVSAFGASVGRPEPDRLELARVYLSHAASAIERETLLTEVSRRNRVLESLRGMLESLAGPERVEGALGIALVALCRGLSADGVGVLVQREDLLEFRATNDGLTPSMDDIAIRMREAAEDVIAQERGMGARFVAPDLAAVPLHLPEGPAALVAHWSAEAPPEADTIELLEDATRSLALAMEGESLEKARREASALRRSHAIQRELLSSLSHELRTPLTAIQGYASTLCQPDLTWDAGSTQRFLTSIVTESGRLERLVGDLLDSTAIESGVLRLQRHWCDLRLILEATIGVVGASIPVRIDLPAGIDAVWGDHDRLEQVFVNLLENAVTHGASADGIDILVRSAGSGWIEVEIRDHGPGLKSGQAERIFEPHVRDSQDVSGAGLGLSIARGIVEAHGGRLLARPADVGMSFLLTLPTEATAGAGDGVDAPWHLTNVPDEADVY